MVLPRRNRSLCHDKTMATIWWSRMRTRNSRRDPSTMMQLSFAAWCAKSHVRRDDIFWHYTGTVRVSSGTGWTCDWHWERKQPLAECSHWRRFGYCVTSFLLCYYDGLLWSIFARSCFSIVHLNKMSVPRYGTRMALGIARWDDHLLSAIIINAWL